MANHLVNIGRTLKWPADRDELIQIDDEINPRFDIGGLAKALDNGFPLLFRKVENYPDRFVTVGLFSRLDPMATMFGANDAAIGLKQPGIDAARNPVMSEMVSNAPCQEIVRRGNASVLEDIPVATRTGLAIIFKTKPGPGHAIKNDVLPARRREVVT